MPIEDRVRERIDTLLEQAVSIRVGNQNGQVISDSHRQVCAGWLTSAVNVIHLVCIQREGAYRVRADVILSEGVHLQAHNQVGELASLLTHLKADAEAGLLSSIANQARAEAFDDFLDHATEYVKQTKKNEAGVIGGVVLEDTVRRICRKHSLPHRDVPLDTLISELAKRDILTLTKAKRARAAAHVRTKATHAQWDEFDLRDVQSCIDLTRELINDELDE